MYINGEFVDDGLVSIEAARIKQRLRSESPNSDEFGIEIKAREVARELVIAHTLLRQAAQKNTTDIPSAAIEAEFKKFQEQSPEQANCLLPRDEETLRANIENDLRIKVFTSALTAHLPKPTSKQVAAIYQHAKQSLAQPETIHAAHIVKNVDESSSENDALDAIRQAQALLQQGIPFEQVADQHSDCPGRGGDLGFFARGAMVEQFDAAVFDLPAGSVSEIFRTPFGFHIVKVYERRAERIPSLNEVRSQLEASLWQQSRNDTVRAFMDEWRARAEVRKSK
jgi:parvulin-like peptidyl-prolyl isomerase